MFGVEGSGFGCLGLGFELMATQSQGLSEKELPLVAEVTATSNLECLYPESQALKA